MKLIVFLFLGALPAVAAPVTLQQTREREQAIREGRMTGGAIHLWNERRWQIHERIMERIASGETSGVEGDCQELLAISTDETGLSKWLELMPIGAAAAVIPALLSGEDERRPPARLPFNESTPEPIPEPATLWMLLAGLALGWHWRRRRLPHQRQQRREITNHEADEPQN